MSKQPLQKLELTWIGKGKEPQLEPRILIEDPSKSFGDAKTENMLINGDNLLALRALEQNFSGKIKCIYIDPPFNTGQAFEHYDDNLEHSIWLNLMYQRIKILYTLLHKDGLMWIHLDDIEVHYCKIFLDEIFGRGGCVAHITYERSAVAGLGQGGFLVNTTEHILLFKKGLLPKRNNLGYYELEQKTMKRYSKFLREEGERELVREFPSKSNGEIVRVYKHKFYQIDPIPLKDFEKRETEIRAYYAKNLTRIFRGNQIQKENAFQRDLISQMDKELYSVDYTPSRGKYEDIKTTLYYFNGELLSWLSDTAEATDGKIVKMQKLTTLWDSEDIPKADIANEGGIYFPRSKKPENLIKRILEISTDPDDIVLDSFLGSGTTAAVAHKMKRKWIGIELGEHAISHCHPRLVSVVKGSDQSGISKGVEWKGGGGFKYYTLAPSLIQKDKYGNDIINTTYNANMLAAAMAKQEGFSYQPHESTYWKQGNSTEKDYIFTTTQFITVEMLDRLAEEMQPNESLLVCCKGFASACKSRHSNITIKKIPQMLFGRCEFGKDDYSLNIVDLPHDETAYTVSDEDEIDSEEPTSKKSKTKSKKDKDERSQSSLF
jgi:adenine-specific DNA-methyltransferase